jgi:F0F1-type ATP synthase membrane subunit a
MMGIRRPLPVMILYAIALHFCWGILGTIDVTTYLSTAASAPFRLFGNLTGAVCIIVAVLALTGLLVRFRSPLTSLMCMIPQQSLLII